jgi:hypothetical protein
MKKCNAISLVIQTLEIQLNINIMTSIELNNTEYAPYYATYIQMAENVDMMKN